MEVIYLAGGGGTPGTVGSSFGMAIFASHDLLNPSRTKTFIGMSRRFAASRMRSASAASQRTKIADLRPGVERVLLAIPNGE
jgi:hypothetical protein